MVKLYEPQGYKLLTPEAKAEICNGAGPSGYGWLVPDTVWGLSITEAANIHDYMYWAGKSVEDKQEADRVFLNNMLRIIDAKSFSILKPLRRYRAMTMYNAVADFGGPAFWSGKDE